jgi:hypothetical protein
VRLDAAPVVVGHVDSRIRASFRHPRRRSVQRMLRDGAVV